MTRQRVDGAQGYVLHTQPFRETSLLVDVFAREHGRLGVVARGARRPRSQVRGALFEFQPLELAWFGAGELKTLARAEWLGGQPLLSGPPLLVGYYLNELLLRLLPREDPHPALFDRYRDTVRELSGGRAEPAVLRRFEVGLLRELGYALVLEHEAESGAAIEPRRHYAYHVERGAVPAEEAPDLPAVSGRTLLAMARDDYSDAETLAQAKQLMRWIIQHHVGAPGLNSRRVFMELQEL